MGSPSMSSSLLVIVSTHTFMYHFKKHYIR